MAYSKRNLYTEQEAINSLDNNTISQQSIPILDKSPQGLEEAAWVKNIQESELQNEQEQLPKPINKTGIPDDLKARLEHEFGFDLSKVRVHYNSDKPAKYGALAYAQNLDIYISPGNEECLEHELRHVIQQMSGEAKANEIINGQPMDSHQGREDEANAGFKQSFPINEEPAPLEVVTPTGNIIQRQVITAEAAEEQMAIVGGDFRNLPYEIISPYGNNPEATNCHGYTVNHAVDNWVDGPNLLGQIGANASIAVFVRNDQIAHSGLLDGNQLTHFLINVGIVQSTIAQDNTAGYDARYNLPAQRGALDLFLTEAAQRAIQRENIEIAGQIIGYASDYPDDVGATDIMAIDDWEDIEDEQEKLTYINDYADELERIRGIFNEVGMNINALNL